MKIAIYGKSFHYDFSDTIKQLFSDLLLFQSNGYQLVVYKPFYEYLLNTVNLELNIDSTFSEYNELNSEFSFLISIGGDGTFLNAISLVRSSGIPIVGINSGRLGFLSTISRHEISEALQAIFNKKYSFESRTLIRVEATNQAFGDFPYALNECTVHKNDSAAMITIHTYLNDEFLNSYWADGLIVSTPTGSTAYSLSVGGPIVMPNAENFIIAPIAPHNLTVRPIVIPDRYEIKLKIESRSKFFLTSLDYRSETMDTEFELKLTKTNFCINILKLDNHNYFSTLRNKLMWGVDKRN